MNNTENKKEVIKILESGLKESLLSYKKDPICLKITDQGFSFSPQSKVGECNYYLQVSPDYDCFNYQFVDEFLEESELDSKKVIKSLGKLKSYSQVLINNKYLSSKYLNKLYSFIKSKQKNPDSNSYIDEIDIIPIVSSVLRKFELDLKS